MAAHAPSRDDTTGGWRSVLASMMHPEFRALYASNMAFFFAMNGQFLVRSVLTYDITDSAAALAVVNIAVAIPMFLISPFGGVIADRFERRRLIILGQIMIVASESVIFGLLIFDMLEFWHLVVTAVFLGCTFPVTMPARQAIVVNIVGKRGLGNAMALQMGGMNASRVVAPVLAGGIIAFAGETITWGFALSLYVVALVGMFRVEKHPPPPNLEKKSVFGDIMEGLRYVQNDKPVKALLLLGLIPVLLAMPFATLLVVFAEDVWEVGDIGFGVLQAFAGIGGVLGSVYVAMIGNSNDRLNRMMVCLLAFGGTLFLFALSPWFLLALPLVLAADLFANVFMTLNNTAIQILIPDEVRGRVNALLMMSFGLTPLGTVPMAIIADVWGAPFAVALAAGLLVVATILFFVFNKALRDVDENTKLAIARDEAIYQAERAAIAEDARSRSTSLDEPVADPVAASAP